jgi:hypothetical protein
MSISNLSSLTGVLTPLITNHTNSTVKNSTAANSAAPAASTTSSNGVVRNYDFTNITPAQLGNVTEKLVQSGQLSVKQAALLRISSEPLGTLGPQGQFEHFSAAQQATLDSTPINAVQAVQSQISQLQSRGKVNDPAYGFKDLTNLLTTLQNLQGTPEGVNIAA